MCRAEGQDGRNEHQSLDVRDGLGAAAWGGAVDCCMRDPLLDAGVRAPAAVLLLCAAVVRCRFVKQGRVRERTQKRYEQIVRDRVLPSLGASGSPDSRPTMSQRVCVQASGTACMARGARDVLLRTALNLAFRWELVSRNVAALTDAPWHRPRRIEPLRPAQASVLLAAVAGYRLEGLITVAVGLGLRQGEAVGLRWEDVDLEAGVLSVRQTLERASFQLRFGEPKTERRRCTIRLPGIVAVLRRHRTPQLEARLAAGERWRRVGVGVHHVDRDRCTGPDCTRSSSRSCAPAGCPTSGTMTWGTRPRRCCWSRRSTRGPSWRRWATPG